MTTNLQLAKLSDLVYEADGGASKIGQVMGADWQLYADPGSLGLSFTTGYFAAAYRNTVTNEIENHGVRSSKRKSWGQV